MIRTVDQILRDWAGDHVLALVKLTAENEALREQIATMRKAAEVAAVYKPNGKAKPNADGAIGSDSVSWMDPS